jgi:hypothetical protein
LLLAAGCGSPSKPTTARQFKGNATRMGVVSGFVLDDETGAPIASAQISVGGTPVRARADGSFDATVPAGRARVEVKNAGFIQTVREVAVGDIALSLPFKLARKEQPRLVGSTGGSFPFREALLTVPPGAFGEGTMVSLTYLGRVRVAVTANLPQFIDTDQTPRRVVATVDLDASAPPAMPVRARVPVPADAAMDSVRGYAVNEAGDWSTPIMPLSVSGGFAEFALTGNTRFGVAIDTRKADGKRIGYLVTEGGDATTAMGAGEVLAGGNEVMTASRAVSMVDPQGSRIEVAPASRVRAEVPASEMGTATRVAPVRRRRHAVAGERAPARAQGERLAHQAVLADAHHQAGRSRHRLLGHQLRGRRGLRRRAVGDRGDRRRRVGRQDQPGQRGRVGHLLHQVRRGRAADVRPAGGRGPDPARRHRCRPRPTPRFPRTWRP